MIVSIINKYIKQFHLIQGIKSEYQRKKKEIDKENKTLVKNYIHTIDEREGYKLIIKDEKRKLKPSELLKAGKVSNPVSQAYIDRIIKSKENSKITNKESVKRQIYKRKGCIYRYGQIFQGSNANLLKEFIIKKTKINGIYCKNYR